MDVLAERLSIYNWPAISIPAAKISVNIALANWDVSFMTPSLLPLFGH